MPPLPGVSGHLLWAHQNLAALLEFMETIQWIRIWQRTIHGVIVLLPAKESQQHLPVLTTLQSQDTRVFGNRIFMISAFTQIATVTLMIPQ